MWWHRHKPERNLGIMYTNRGQYRECMCGRRQYGRIPPFGQYIVWEHSWRKVWP